VALLLLVAAGAFLWFQLGDGEYNFRQVVREEYTEPREIEVQFRSEIEGLKLTAHSGTRSWMEAAFTGLKYDYSRQLIDFGSGETLSPERVVYVVRPMSQLAEAERQQLLHTIGPAGQPLVGHNSRKISLTTVEYNIYIELKLTEDYKKENLARNLSYHLINSLFTAKPQPGKTIELRDEAFQLVSSIGYFPFNLEIVGQLSRVEQGWNWLGQAAAWLLRGVATQVGAATYPPECLDSLFECGSWQEIFRCANGEYCSGPGDNCGDGSNCASQGFGCHHGGGGSSMGCNTQNYGSCESPQCPAQFCYISGAQNCYPGGGGGGPGPTPTPTPPSCTCNCGSEVSPQCPDIMNDHCLFWGRYFSFHNENLWGQLKAQRFEGPINYSGDWTHFGEGGRPICTSWSGINWAGHLNILTAGTYQFRFDWDYNDHVAYIHVNHTVVADKWGFGSSSIEGQINLPVGWFPIEVGLGFREQATNNRTARLYWKPPWASDWEILPMQTGGGDCRIRPCSPPNNPDPPTCSLSIPNGPYYQGNSTINVSFTGTSPGETNKEVKLWVQKRDATPITPTPSPWIYRWDNRSDQIGRCYTQSNGTCSTMVSISNLNAGEYYFHCDLQQAAGGSCTGQPFCYDNNTWLNPISPVPQYNTSCGSSQLSCHDTNDRRYIQVLPPPTATVRGRACYTSDHTQIVCNTCNSFPIGTSFAGTLRLTGQANIGVSNNAWSQFTNVPQPADSIVLSMVTAATDWSVRTGNQTLGQSLWTPPTVTISRNFCVTDIAPAWFQVWHGEVGAGGSSGNISNRLPMNIYNNNTARFSMPISTGAPYSAGAVLTRGTLTAGQVARVNNWRGVGALNSAMTTGYAYFRPLFYQTGEPITTTTISTSTLPVYSEPGTKVYQRIGNLTISELTIPAGHKSGYLCDRNGHN
jgi:hypothetical protein